MEVPKMNELNVNLTVLTIVIIAAIIFVTVAVFVMFAILCSNVAQIKRTLIKTYDVIRKRNSKSKDQISVDYLK